MKVDIEELIKQDIASKLLATIPIEQREQLLEASLNKTLESVLSAWSVERVIKADVEKYMVEYLQNPDVQLRIKEATIKGVDVLMDGVAKAVVIGAQEQLQNTYAKLVEAKKV